MVSWKYSWDKKCLNILKDYLSVNQNINVEVIEIGKRTRKDFRR